MFVLQKQRELQRKSFSFIFSATNLKRPPAHLLTTCPSAGRYPNSNTRGPQRETEP